MCLCVCISVDYDQIVHVFLYHFVKLHTIYYMILFDS